MATSVGSKELGKLELWELGRRRLGYGDWTEDNPEPYPKWAGMQAHRLFLSMRKRKATQEDFLLCVDYCARHHIRIENAIWVFSHYKEARQEQRDLLASQPGVIDALIESAVARERSLALPDSDEWVQRLTRSIGVYRKEVLGEWAQARNLSITIPA